MKVTTKKKEVKPHMIEHYERMVQRKREEKASADIA